MSRRKRKLERHRQERNCRRHELARRRQAHAGEIRIPQTLPDGGGFSREEWEDLAALHFTEMAARARELFPRCRLVQRFARSRLDLRTLRGGEAKELADRMTLAARTIRCDPPWRLPRVDFAPDGVGGGFTLGFDRPEVEVFSAVARDAWWGLKLEAKGEAPMPVWFSSHSVERLIERLGLLDPVLRIASADGLWHLLGAEGPQLAALGFRRVLERIDGRPFLQVFCPIDGVERPAGRFPLDRWSNRWIARTFLEPWMFCARHRREPGWEAAQEPARTVHRNTTLPAVVERLGRCTSARVGMEAYSAFRDCLGREAVRQPSRLPGWLEQMQAGMRRVEERRWVEAKAMLEGSLARFEAERNHVSDTSWQRMCASSAVRGALGRARFCLAQLYSLSSVGGLSGGASLGPRDPAVAVALLAKGRALLQQALADDPELGELGGDDPELRRLRA